jgi:betaine reductase
MGPIKVVQYVNQFFGQLGGEEKANVEMQVEEGPIGVGLAVQRELGEKGQVVATIICGDNYFTENLTAATEQAIEIMKKYQPDLLIAGPAFNAGRYGVAAGALCQAAQDKLDIPAVTAMYEENPGVDLYRRNVYILKTGDSARELNSVVQRMVNLGLRLYNKERIGKPGEEGYFKRSILVNEQSDKTAAERGVDMLLALLKGEKIEPEINLVVYDKVEPAPAVKDIGAAKVALITDGGLVPTGNPDKLEWRAATKYVMIDPGDEGVLKAGEYYGNHTGYDTKAVNADPHRLVPLDVARELEGKGIIGKLHPVIYSTTGVSTPIDSAQKIGQAIVDSLKAESIDAVILTST